jgi:hypothetical protein
MTNITNKEVYMEQIHIGGHKLCNKMVGGQNITNKYCSNDNKIYV